MPRLFARVAVSMTAVAALVALAAPPAGAVVRPTPPRGTPRASPATQMQLSSLGVGTNVTGLIANTDSGFNPVRDGYPASDPTTGFTPKNEPFAGIIHGTATDGSNAQLSLYCFDILTDTWVGITYILGTWNASNVPNVNYVAQVLNHYYPHTDEPASLTDLNQRAAAVQAAIWFFSDSYVLSTSDPLHDAVASIVAAVIAEGPAQPPKPPSVNITPETISGTGSILGPFTVNTTSPATLTSVGADMFEDSGETKPIPQGTVVNDGQTVWLKRTASSPTAELLATAEATVPQNNVYLPDQGNYQRLILAQDATLRTTVLGTALFKETGSLVVNKTITGAAAGKQGPVTILVRCGENGGVLIGDPFVIPAGSTGTTSKTYDNIPVGTSCTATEQHDGSSSSVTVEVTGSGTPVTIGGVTTVTITDTYSYPKPASLIVKKSIQGEGAGKQGEIVIQPTCNGTDLERFTIPAGAAAGEQSKTYTGLAPDSVCTITETRSGSNSVVSVTTTVTGEGVAIPAGDTGEIDVRDAYTLKPGSLVVNKTIAGGGAGQQGPITITVSCIHDGTTTTLDPVINIPAGATTIPPTTYTDIPGGSVCTIVEDPDGHNTTVAVSKRGDGQEVIIPSGGEATADLTDTYDVGSLVVNKTITGDAAGHQGEITIHTVCNGTALEDFVIPAGKPAGSYSMTYPNVIAGATCTVTETGDGGTSTITVDTTGSPQDVDISEGGTGTADISDAYAFVSGSLEVTKTINGPSAGKQGEVRIQVDCGEQVDTPDFLIAAGATGPQTHTYDDIPANTVCLVTETQDGSSSTVAVTVKGSPGHATIAPDETATVEITDTYAPAPGTLVVTKTINGALAGSQDAITIEVKCGATSLPTITIPAGTPAKTVTHTYDNIPADSSCTITETSNGATTTVEASVVGGTQTLLVPAAVTQAASITDTYSAAPGALKVTKRLAGAAAGQQGRVGILVACGTTLQAFALVIPAKHAAGPVTQVFSGVGGGSHCLVAEVVDGHTGDLTVVAIGGRQRTTVPAAGLASVHMTDRFGVEALAVTGPRAPVAALLGIALAAIVAGAGALMLGRRRER